VERALGRPRYVLAGHGQESSIRERVGAGQNRVRERQGERVLHELSVGIRGPFRDSLQVLASEHEDIVFRHVIAGGMCQTVSDDAGGAAEVLESSRIELHDVPVPARIPDVKARRHPLQLGRGHDQGAGGVRSGSRRGSVEHLLRSQAPDVVPVLEPRRVHDTVEAGDVDGLVPHPHGVADADDVGHLAADRVLHQILELEWIVHRRLDDRKRVRVRHGLGAQGHRGS
jgi:hypothetical protein